MAQTPPYVVPAGLVAGPYLWEMSSPLDNTLRYVGMNEEPVTIEFAPQFEEVIGDNMGQTIQDILYLGGTLSISGIFKEFDNLAWRGIWPWGEAVNGTDLSSAIGYGGLDLIGGFARATQHPAGSGSLATFRFRGTARHNWNTTKPQVIDLPTVTSAPNNPLSYACGTTTRNFPFRFIALPNDLGQTAGPAAFHTTTP